jgi:hypothetical protein
VHARKVIAASVVNVVVVASFMSTTSSSTSILHLTDPRTFPVPGIMIGIMLIIHLHAPKNLIVSLSLKDIATTHLDISTSILIATGIVIATRAAHEDRASTPLDRNSETRIVCSP